MVLGADIPTFGTTSKETILRQFAPASLTCVHESQSAIPHLAKDKAAIRDIETILPTLPTFHQMRLGDARDLAFLAPESVHLVLTSPPYWTLKQYHSCQGQLGNVGDYDSFLAALDQVWKHCFRVLVPGGRLICVVGDVCLSRRSNNGRHTVVPLPAMPEFASTSYAQRYEILCRKLVQEQLYDAAALVLTEMSGATRGISRSVSDLTSARRFASTLAGKIAAVAGESRK
jgi:hypothetical protein